MQSTKCARTARRLALLRPLWEMLTFCAHHGRHNAKTLKVGNSSALAALLFRQPEKAVEDRGAARWRGRLRSFTFYAFITFILVMFICVYIVI